MKRGIRSWSAKLHIPVTRMMSRVLREEIHAALFTPHQKQTRWQAMAADQIETLKGLLERVKAAKGYDRELDAEFAEALGHEISWEQARYTMDHFPAIAWQAPHPYAGMRVPCPDFTTSIDAALGIARPHLPGWVSQHRPIGRLPAPVVTMGALASNEQAGRRRAPNGTIGLLPSHLRSDPSGSPDAAKSAPLLNRSETDGGRGAP